MKKKISNFRFSDDVNFILDKTSKATGKSKTAILSDAALEKCKKLLKEIESLKG
jgi:predicted DNA-binding protein